MPFTGQKKKSNGVIHSVPIIFSSLIISFELTLFIMNVWTASWSLIVEASRRKRKFRGLYVLHCKYYTRLEINDGL